MIITGCSSGIGRCTARHLVEQGYEVYATARRIEVLRDLASAGAHVLAVDVADESSMRECVGVVESRHGAVWGLINNAGYALAGPVEELRMADIHRQFQVNVFGHIAMTQLVLPGIRAEGGGRIVNISSVASRFTLPGGGGYHASKHALSSFSEALRYEVRPFGVHVSAVEPGAVCTRFIETALKVLASSAAPGISEYASFRSALAHCYRSVQASPRRYGVVSPQRVACAVERALSVRPPRSRYVVGAAARTSLAFRQWLPEKWFDALVHRHFPVPQREG
ncbi:SDR family NAD(P)-dependent oxidoreductase [Streptomyces sp. NPDC048650]|uniref:SDR family NAD(P)-dependent oxidoreductase n=1 Tax=Streptomyces sp. NPDC048650 TaxID=3365583 RepID=UPI00371EB4A4